MANGLTLAITNIRDLLLENRLTRGQDDKAIPDIRLTIPNYQRPYKWTAKNVIQLLDDIIDARNHNKEVYRVGTLILHHDTENKDGASYNIVDGQQRTISFCLLLKAFPEMKDTKIDFLNQMVSDNAYTRNNIPKNFAALKRRIEGIADEKDRNELREYIENRCELVVVITDDISEAFQFFDSQNARGKKLYPHDLFKAYHLREMNDLPADETEKIVKSWEDHDQAELAELFSEYLYRVKEWIRGNYADGLTEQNIGKFKGITRRENFPYAQFYKGAYAYADTVNRSSMPFVAGMQKLSAFQIDSPIIAGKPFFDYTNHYFGVLKDIRNNDAYEGYYIKDNPIVKTLDLNKYTHGTGNCITRLLFDTAALLYVDRFCPEIPSPKDTELLDNFIRYDFLWAYSLRAQYKNLGWYSAQNYILGRTMNRKLRNSFNIYKTISEADSPSALLSTLADKVIPLRRQDLARDESEEVKKDEDKQNAKQKDEREYQYYLHFFKAFHYLEDLG